MRLPTLSCLNKEVGKTPELVSSPTSITVTENGSECTSYFVTSANIIGASSGGISCTEFDKDDYILVGDAEYVPSDKLSIVAVVALLFHKKLKGLLPFGITVADPPLPPWHGDTVLNVVSKPGSDRTSISSLNWQLLISVTVT